MNTKPVTLPLDDDNLYLAYDRFVCSSPRCAGSTALATGHTIDGYPLSVVTPDDLRAWEAISDLPLQCECGRMEASFIQGIATVLPTD